MRTFATLCASLSLLTFAACNGGGGSGDDTGDDVLEPDAETGMPDAEIEPDADNSCTTDTECVGHNAGDTLCMGAAVVTCSANGLCLDATTVPCNVGDMCVDDGSAACETPVADGETCATAMPITADTTIAGADFTADFANDHDFTDPSCDDADPATTNSEAVFAVELAANERLVVSESLGLDTVMGVQQTCGDTSACLQAVDDDPYSIVYDPGAATTVFVYVGTFAAAPTAPSYSLDFDISFCGDGQVDADFEECDDGLAPADDDGCSTSCQFEFGFTCDDAEPTVCAALPDLGTHAGGATITANSATAVAAGDSVLYTVTFTVPVRVTGTLTATAGNADWYAHTPTEFELYGEANPGDEIIGDENERYFTPGTYVVEVYAPTALTAGYALSMTTVAPTHADLGTFAAAATIPPVVDADGMAAGVSNYYMITFSAAVEVSGTLVSGTGDIDLYWWKAGDVMFTSLALGDESFADEPLPAATYYVRTNAYWDDVAVDTSTLTLSTVAPPP